MPRSYFISKGTPATGFNTVLTPDGERAFKSWKTIYAPNDSGSDYDLRGAFAEGIKPAANGHWPDTYKKPTEPTFSNESQYAKYAPSMAGHWNGDTYIPRAASLEARDERNASMPKLNFIPSSGASFYDGILKPGPKGGIYQPGPQVMMPPQGFPPPRYGAPPDTQGQTMSEQQGMRGDGTDAIIQALLERGFNATPYEGYGDYNPYRSGATASMGIPGASGTTVPNKDPSQLVPSDPANAFAYGDGAPTAPGVDAISGAIMPPMPIPRPTPPGGVDWSQTAPDGLRPDGTYGGPQTGFAADPVNVTVNGGVRMPMGAPVKRKVTPAVPQGPGANGRPGAGTIKNNPTKYGKTQQARNDYQSARQAFLASWNSA